MKPLYQLTIKEASDLLEEKKISSLDLVESVFKRIDQVDEKVKAYLLLNRDGAIKSAKLSDERISRGKRIGRLDGIPISVKDLLCTKGIETTAASNILKGFIPSYNATVVEKLERAGAIIVGKTNLDAFAHGSSTENSDFQVTKNPWDLNRIPGGSSGGSAAAVAADMCLASIGTDTGGSIRQPASLCSVVGFKPSYGRVSRYGVIAMASSLDVVGPLAKTAEDASIMMDAISGPDDLDPTTIKENENFTNLKPISLKGLKFALPREFFAKGIDEDVKSVIMKAVDDIKGSGGEIVEISLPSVKYALSVYYIIQPAEVSSNLQRYDGVRYGHSAYRDRNDLKLEELYTNSRGQGFGKEAKRRIMLGTYVLSAGYYDAYYKKALKIRTLVKNDFDKAFDKSAGGADFVITPVSPTPAFKVGEKSNDPIQMYLSDIYTVPINPAGVPAISLPAGFVERVTSKLPVGMQVIGSFKDDKRLLEASIALQDLLKIDEKPNL
ncbi:MAG: Glutamyl-tRNA(Gln) amidotransferase subunit A [candidate division WS2 bacterium ADurb.Bin280]|uniref:Glutamyl-tRNA(Gln) amidotransferase subunit A n=1 Tax=candidate division WS2 bacterium ADurb.Bin280 TaxID=1852829 RepID=A0A1V5SCS1_9BACT|nr:MAG: Glutamyl-tRNA(Gln) amidotransferase subunit A [candidate division WS2 bacterium ADurb.Bin280]